MKSGAPLFLLLIMCFFLLPACTTTEEKSSPMPSVKSTVKVPDWILHYKNAKKICGVGVSKRHIKGLAYQRLLAISRGIDEIARQLGVTVETRLETYMTGTSESVSTGLSSYSVQTSSGQTVEAEIEEAWMNEETEEFYVLMCMDK